VQVRVSNTYTNAKYAYNRLVFVYVLPAEAPLVLACAITWSPLAHELQTPVGDLQFYAGEDVYF